MLERGSIFMLCSVKTHHFALLIVNITSDVFPSSLNWLYLLLLILQEYYQTSFCYERVERISDLILDQTLFLTLLYKRQCSITFCQHFPSSTLFASSAQKDTVKRFKAILTKMSTYLSTIEKVLGLVCSFIYVYQKRISLGYEGSQKNDQQKFNKCHTSLDSPPKFVTLMSPAESNRISYRIL